MDDNNLQLQNSRGLYWLRCDLRLADNLALTNLCRECTDALIVWSPSKSYLRAGAARKSYIDRSLAAFDEQIKLRGLNLVRLKDSIDSSLTKILTELKIKKIFFSEHISPEEKAEETAVKRAAANCNVAVFEYPQSTLLTESNLPFQVQEMPLVFTDFRKRLENAQFSKKCEIEKPLEVPVKWPKQIEFATADQSTARNDSSPETQFSAGEQVGLAQLNYYLFDSKLVLNYKETRNGFEFEDSTKFSPFLAVGSPSPRTVYSELKRFEAEIEENESTYWVFFELLWRDYFKFLAQRFGPQMFVLEGIPTNLAKKPKVVPQADKTIFETWVNGQTSEPFINANMIELKKTGWMSNRGRQNVASYLIHDLCQPWVWGAQHFEAELIDYDPESNWGNWLYLSGNGTDPRARKFDIQRQASMYDPNRTYQQKWTN